MSDDELLGLQGRERSPFRGDQFNQAAVLLVSREDHLVLVQGGWPEVSLGVMKGRNEDAEGNVSPYRGVWGG
ncbi:MAG: hypothetical protein HY278_08280 [candidate division NC10 bacterium]|nr:hypothetical protein [candidate division NC10 bacterium]